MYVKMFRSMFDGTLATRGPWEAMVTFQQMLILADNKGIVDMTAETISRQSTVPLAIIRIGITALEQPDPDSRNQSMNGCRIKRLHDHIDWGWFIVNHQHYRDLKSEDKRRAYMREYQKQRRARLAAERDRAIG